MIKVFVGGIPQNLEEIDLAQLAATYGELITVKIIRDRKTGKGKGYAFVEMADLDAAENVVAQLNGTKFRKNELTLNIVENQSKSIAPPVYKKSQPNNQLGKTKRPRKPPTA